MRTTILPILAFFLLLPPATAQQQQLDPSLDWEEVARPEGDIALRWPVALAAGSANELAVADVYESRLLILAKQGLSWTLVRKIDLGGAPYSVAHDGNRYLVSLRKGAGLLAVEGELHQLRKIALPAGVVPGVLAGVPGGGFLVYDFGSGDVLKLDAGGSVTDRWPVDGPLTGLTVVAGRGFLATVAHRAEVLFHDTDGNEIQRFDVPGDSPTPAWPTGIVKAPGGNVFIVDRHAGRLLEMGLGGRAEGRGARKGWAPGLLRFPAGLALLPDGRLAVADEGNGRVQIFRPVPGDGNP
jgi:hypothetical protein